MSTQSKKSAQKDLLLAQIAAQLENLKESPLYAYRIENGYKSVAGEGSADARVVFVGEAPGKTEAITGHPFCGRSGKFLDEMLTAQKLSRTDVFITNVVKDRPHDNRDPKPEEIALYGPMLLQQLEVIQPDVIIALGRIPLRFIMESFGLTNRIALISEIHGEIFEGTASWGSPKVVALYHPAVALYSGSMRPVLHADFAQVIAAIRNA